MKIKLITIAMILSLTAGFNATAFDLDGVTIDVEKKEMKHAHKKRGHKMKLEFSKIVQDYMLAQGDITQGEIDARKLEREAIHTELKSYKEAGDTEGLAVRKAELKAKHEERRVAMKQYIEDNEALKEQLAEKKQEVRENSKERREKHKEKRHDKKSKKQDKETTH